MLSGVICAHSSSWLKPQGQQGLVHILSPLTVPLGMPGFFLLSSFLLAYRLYDKMAKIVFSWFGLVTLTHTGHHLWTIAIEIMYYFIIPAIRLAFKVASQRSTTKIGFMSVLTVLCYLGCNYNLTRVDLKEYHDYRYSAVLTCFKLSFFVFLSGSLIALLLHSIHMDRTLSAMLKQNKVQLAISILSHIQFTRAYKISMWPQGDKVMIYMHVPGFE